MNSPAPLRRALRRVEERAREAAHVWERVAPSMSIEARDAAHADIERTQERVRKMLSHSRDPEDAA